MDHLLRETLDLQPVWEAKNTPAMSRRGVIVRTEIPAWIRAHCEGVYAAMGVPAEDFGIEGKDGTGLKTEIPWVRIYSSSHSARATSGWYVVYLFSASGDRVYLSLNQGTTIWTGTDFQPRSGQELKARVDWARPLITAAVASRDGLVDDIELHAKRTDLGKCYEDGNVIAIEYTRDAMPAPESFAEDLLFMAGLLKTVYGAQDSTPYIPGDVPPEVVEAEESAARTAGRRMKAQRGQGRGLSSDEKRAVELHSVRMAEDYFKGHGWTVKDVGAKESFDLLLNREEECLHVEVKGTTSLGGQVILTRAEVEHHKTQFPDNALVVVHSIILDRSVKPATASGGILECVSPWTVEDTDLTVVSYVYRTGL